MSSPTEQLVEDVASVYFRASGAVTKRGVEIDDAGERSDASQVTLKGRLAAALHRLNTDLPHDSIEEVVRMLSRPPHPTLIQNNLWFHSLLTDGVEVQYREVESGETRGGRAPTGRFRQPGRERASGGAPAHRYWGFGQGDPPRPDGIPEWAAARGDRAKGPNRH